MESAPTLEPTLRADRIVDAALVAVVLALFVASAFGLTELPGGAVEWEPLEWKGVHDAAKGLILPLLVLRMACPFRGQADTVEPCVGRDGLCWVGDLALTFSGDGFPHWAGSFLTGHLFSSLSGTDWSGAPALRNEPKPWPWSCFSAS